MKMVDFLIFGQYKMIKKFAEQMRSHTLHHPKEECMRECEYSNDLTVQCVLKLNVLEGYYGWQLLINNKDKKSDLPNDIVQEFLNAFFASEAFELPRFPIFISQRRFIAIEAKIGDASL
jgi:hypothetical protein